MKNKINQTTFSIPLENLILLRKYAGELTAKTGIQHSVSDLILSSVNDKFSKLLNFKQDNEK